MPSDKRVATEDEAAGDRSALMQTVRALPRISPGQTVATLVGVLVTGLAPVAYILAAGALVNGIDRDATTWLAQILLAAGFVVLREVSIPFGTAMAETFGYGINRALRLRLMRAALAPGGVAHLEDPRHADLVAAATRIGGSGLTPGAATAALATIGSIHIQAIGSAALLSTFGWWLGPLLLAASWTALVLLVRDFRRSVDVVSGQNTALRRARYFRDLVTGPAAALELRLFSLSDWALGHFHDEWSSAMTAVWRARRPNVGRALVAIGLVAATVATIIWSVGRTAVDATATSGDQLVLGLAVLGTLPLYAIDLRYLTIASGAAAFPAVRAVERLAASATAEAMPALRAVPYGAPSVALAFEGVSFSYPGTQGLVLDDVSFVVPAASSLALVGLNGAGKTSLVKLLARLYEPTAGRIMIDGVDLREYDVDSWRRQLAVMLQDPVRLPFTMADNIRFGSLHSDMDDVALAAAARRTGVDAVLASLPNGWETTLSAGIRGGVDLSGGQWQRVIAARAAYAISKGASLVVLDEPTSHLDVRSEAAFVDRFVADRGGATVVLVSHRLPAVRRADTIVVLDAGRVHECGRHDELVRAGGTYAMLFEVQRRQFNDG